MSAWSVLRNPPLTPLVPIHASICTEKGVELWVKRDDLLQMGEEDGFCGNKWRKLQYNLLAAREGGHTQLLTFGGAYSNHIAATASAGRLFNFRTIGVIRGHAPPGGNTSLRSAEANGMRLHFVDRSTYRRKTEAAFLEDLHQQYGEFYLIPEGGSNSRAMQGCAALGTELLAQCKTRPLYIALACGTGGTLAGLVQGLNPTINVLGFSVLKGGFMTTEINKLLKHTSPGTIAEWHIFDDYHFGGFAKFTPELIEFINTFKAQYGIPLDPLYTGKLFWGLMDLIRQDYFPPGAQVVAVHTGGLQGIRGFNERFGPLIG